MTLAKKLLTSDTAACSAWDLEQVQLLIKEMVLTFKQQQAVTVGELRRLRQENENLRMYVKANAVSRSNIDEILAEKFKIAEMKMFGDFSMWQKSLESDFQGASLQRELGILRDRVHRLEDNLVETINK